jgi:hypothetical protein
MSRVYWAGRKKPQPRLYNTAGPGSRPAPVEVPPEVKAEPRFLCLCEYGHSRSVAMARILHHHKQQAVACGWRTAGSGLAVLCDWADTIITMETHFAQRVPAPYRVKVIDANVGPDKWANPFNRDLLKLCDQFAQVNLSLPSAGFFTV